MFVACFYVKYVKYFKYGYGWQLGKNAAVTRWSFISTQSLDENDKKKTSLHYRASKTPLLYIVEIQQLFINNTVKYAVVKEVLKFGT